MEYNRMQIIKRRFYAMRNGIIADTLRKAGLDYRMIFGLNLPQITEIAAEQPHTSQLAEELWADRRTRESMLLAPMLYPPSEMTADTAARWLAEAPTTEVADVLCLKLLRNVGSAVDIAMKAIDSSSEMSRYTALRLLFNTLIISPSPATLAAAILPAAERELAADSRLTRPVASQLLDEIKFHLEN